MLDGVIRSLLVISFRMVFSVAVETEDRAVKREMEENGNKKSSYFFSERLVEKETEIKCRGR